MTTLRIETLVPEVWFLGRSAREQDALTFYRTAGPARMTGGAWGEHLPVRAPDGSVTQTRLVDLLAARDGLRSGVPDAQVQEALRGEVVLSRCAEVVHVRFNGLYRIPALAEFLADLGALGVRVWVDFDDDWQARAGDGSAVWVGDPETPAGKAAMALLARDWQTARAVMAAACGITVSTPTLGAAFAPYARRVLVLANALAARLVPPPPRPPGPLRIGAVVSGTHERDMPVCWVGMLEAARRVGGQVILLGHRAATRGGRPPLRSTVTGVPVHCYPVLPFRAYLALCATLDIAVAPLADLAENRAKSACKWLEYSLGAVPGVYADLAPYAGAVTHGVTGLLARTPDDYTAQIRLLATDADYRRRMGAAAQAAAHAGHGLAARAPAWRAATWHLRADAALAR